jgi:hypothetical protein
MGIHQNGFAWRDRRYLVSSMDSRTRAQAISRRTGLHGPCGPYPATAKPVLPTQEQSVGAPPASERRRGSPKGNHHITGEHVGAFCPAVPGSDDANRQGQRNYAFQSSLWAKPSLKNSNSNSPSLRAVETKARPSAVKARPFGR